mgnify:CR=1 FL=1
MKQLVLLLASILLYSIVCSQEIRGKRISCVDGIPLECLKTGDVLQGEEVAYEVKKDVSSLFLKNRNNRYDTLGIEDGYQKGHVYVAMPPLYKVIPSKGKEEYLYDDAALEKYRKTHTGSFTLQRYKGLGEMDAEQLWETTLNPQTRVMKRVEIEDGRMASDVTAMLMGTDVPPRKAFIYEHANDAILDV